MRVVVKGYAEDEVVSVFKAAARAIIGIDHEVTLQR
jgi:hypothetical protein